MSKNDARKYEVIRKKAFINSKIKSCNELLDFVGTYISDAEDEQAIEADAVKMKILQLKQELKEMNEKNQKHNFPEKKLKDKIESQVVKKKNLEERESRNKDVEAQVIKKLD